MVSRRLVGSLCAGALLLTGLQASPAFAAADADTATPVPGSSAAPVAGAEPGTEPSASPSSGTVSGTVAGEPSGGASPTSGGSATPAPEADSSPAPGSDPSGEVNSGVALEPNTNPLPAPQPVDCGGLTASYTTGTGTASCDAANHVMTLSGQSDFLVQGTTTTTSLVITDDTPVRFKSVNIDVHNLRGRSAVTIQSARVALQLDEASILLGNAPGMAVSGGSELTISGTGSLHSSLKLTDADAPHAIGAYVPGCGIAVGQSARLVIDSGQVTARGANDCGIGGGSYSAGGEVVIHGGLVKASGELGAGIGGGMNGAGGSVEISGGTVEANSYSGAAIGGGFAANGGTTTITGGDVLAASFNGAGIGGGAASNLSVGSGGKTTITGGTVTARATGTGAGIGGGGDAHVGAGLANPGNGGETVIGGGEVSASGNSGAGIGGGGSTAPHATAGTGAKTTITGGTVVASSAAGGAIGSGNSHDGPQNGALVVDGGALTLTGDASKQPPIVNSTGESLVPTLLSAADGLVVDGQGMITGCQLAGGYTCGITSDPANHVYGIVGTHVDANGQVDLYLPVPDTVDTCGGLTVSYQPADGVSHTCAASALTLTGPGQFTLSGSSQTTGVVAESNSTVVLNGVSVDVHGQSDAAAFVADGAGITVSLAEGSTSSLVSGDNRGGLEVNTGSAVTIDGAGSLTAKSLSVDPNSNQGQGAGIGGGLSRAAGAITIAGGTVSTESIYGAGIGGGRGASGGSIEITGGTITAASGAGAGIGGGQRGAGGAVMVSGGTITAASSVGSGIGGGQQGDGGATRISGGTVHADSARSAGIGAGQYGAGAGRLGIDGGSVEVDQSSNPVAAQPTNTAGRQLTEVVLAASQGITVDDTGQVTSCALGNYSCATIADSEQQVYGISDVRLNAAGQVHFWLPSAALVDPIGFDCGGLSVSYVLGGNSSHTCTAAELTLSGPGPFTLSGASETVGVVAGPDSAVVLAGVSIDLSDVFDGTGLYVNGSGVTVSLADGSINSLTAGNGGAGLEVSAGASATIAGTGTLTAVGDNGAGIGGSYGESAGDITITGGTITTSSNSGAGIGGGQGDGLSAGENGNGGTVTITGGTIQTASVDGAALGGGRNGNGGTVTITGGTITAAGRLGAGVGGGAFGAGGSVQISGGTLSATGSGAAAIGGGNMSTGGDVLITGGTVSAISSGRAGIGAGAISTSADPGHLVIDGGSVQISSARESSSATPQNSVGADLSEVALAADQGISVAADGQVSGCSFGYYFCDASPSAFSHFYGIAGARVDDAGQVHFWLPTSLVNPFKFDCGDLRVAYTLGAGSSHSCVKNSETGIDELSLVGPGPFTLSGGIAKATVTTGPNSTVVLEGVSIDVSALDDAAAFVVGGTGVTVEIPTGSYSDLRSGVNRAGLEVGTDAGVVIEGDGTLTARSGASAEQKGYGAGIGSAGGSVTAGAIEIRGGHIIANSDHGAGIGGGVGGDSAALTITGGVIEATSVQGAGIGGGAYGTSQQTLIRGGTVSATSKLGAGFGGGYDAAGGVIMVGGGTVRATSDSGAGFGGGDGAAGGIITVSGGAVSAQSKSGAGIGGGLAGPGGDVFIAGGTVVAGAHSGAGIGAGFSRGVADPGLLTVDGGSVSVSGAVGLRPKTVHNSADVRLGMVSLDADSGLVVDPAGRVTDCSVAGYRCAATPAAGNQVYGSGGVRVDEQGNAYFWLPLPAHAAPTVDVSWELDATSGMFTPVVADIPGGVYAFAGQETEEPRGPQVAPAGSIQVSAYVLADETHEQSAVTSVTAVAPKLAQDAPPVALTGVFDPATNTYTVTIAAVVGAEYSFDGQDFSDVRTLSGVAPGTTVTGYAYLSGDDTHDDSPVGDNSVSLAGYQAPVVTVQVENQDSATGQRASLDVGLSGLVANPALSYHLSGGLYGPVAPVGGSCAGLDWTTAPLAGAIDASVRPGDITGDGAALPGLGAAQLQVGCYSYGLQATVEFNGQPISGLLTEVAIGSAELTLQVAPAFSGGLPTTGDTAPVPGSAASSGVQLPLAVLRRKTRR